MKSFSQIDLGSFLLSIAVAIGFFAFIVLIIRSIEIPIRIYLDKRKQRQVSELLEKKNEENGSNI